MKKSTLKQRILGCLSFSLITHLGVIAAAFVLPSLARQPSPAQHEVSQTAAAPAVSSQTEIVAPANETPVEVVQAAAEAAPEQEKLAMNDPLPLKQDDVVAPVLPKKPHSEKSEKIATALPEKHSEKNSKLIKSTADDADVKLKQALLESRRDEKSQARPEVAGDIAVPASQTGSAPQQVSQNDLPEQLQPDATFPEESSSTPASQQEAAVPIKQEPTIAPIQKSAPQTAAPSQAAIRNGDDLKEAPGNIRPVYPLTDRRAGHQGTVVFIARITPDGQIMNIRMEKSSESSSLDAAAYSAFRTYRYQNGQEGLIRKAFTFTLKGDAVEAPVARR